MASAVAVVFCWWGCQVGAVPSPLPFILASASPRRTELLRDAGLLKRASEVVFYGADEKTEKIREVEVLQRFARALSSEHACRSAVRPVWARNDHPLTQALSLLQHCRCRRTPSHTTHIWCHDSVNNADTC